MASAYELLMKIGGKLDPSYGKSVSGATKSLSLLEKATKPVSSGISSIGSKLVGLAAGALAGITLTTVASNAATASKTMAQMGAVLKSTGGAAGMSEQQLIDLASAQAKVTTYSAGTTKQAENMLLTFTNIKSNVFPQTITAAEDMATAMGTSATDAAKTLGKAMNDPAAGLSKLTKQGVTFTVAQKKQITAMEKAGNTAGAQKVILSELNKEFGGSAKAAGDTLSGQITKAKNSLMGAAVVAFTAIMPVVTKLLPSVVGGVQKISSFIQAHQKDITNVAQKIGSVIFTVVGMVTKIISTVEPFVEPIIKDIVQIATNFLPTLGKSTGDLGGKVVGLVSGGMAGLKGVLDWVAQHGPIVKGVIAGLATGFVVLKGVTLAAKVAQEAHNAILIISALRTGGVTAAKLAMNGASGVEAAVTGSATAAQWLLNAAMSVGLLPIIAIVAGIAILVAAFVILWTKCKGFRDFLTGLWSGIKSGFSTVVNFIISGINLLTSSILAPFNLIIKGLDLIPGVKLPQLSLTIPKIPQFATGINNFSGGMALVGEKGPELVNLPKGSQVVNNQNTNKLLSGGSSSSGSSGSITLVYSPQITIQGNASKADTQKVVDDDKARFEQWFDAKIRDMKRRSPSGKVSFG